MPKEIAKAYEPNKFEKDIYRMWESGGYFRSEIDENKEPFVIMMPPPNATGVLHLGHAVFIAISDIVIRYKRMCGYNALWLPGTDHAAIATQTKVEKILAKEGLTRFDLGREKFIERVKEFVEGSRDTMRKQLRLAGSSCDWSREAYTFSDDLSQAVNEAFVRLYEKGLIYRGDRIVNWCPRCGSTLADDEVEHKEEKTVLYTFKYAEDFPFEIATTRPETKLGDTGVAVHPDDERYKEYIGKTFEVDFCGQKLSLKVIADSQVEKDFGTGALGVTPAHSYIDFEMAQANDLPVIKIIGEDGRMNEAAGEYEGMSVEEARKKVVEKLREKDLITKEEEIDHNLSVCYRCETGVEPLTSKQWFIDVKKKVPGWNVSKFGLEEGEYSIKDVASHVVRSGQIEMMPERYNKVYFGWMDNLRDWCISRQIWWGHQIPVWYRQDDGRGTQQRARTDNDIHVGPNPPAEGTWIQDEDTLDTWFSSGLWTFSTLGWPNDTPDLKYYHPTQFMETGREIIFQWVARMIIMTTYLVGDIPFRKVYFHGMLFDKQGRKMSKSLGNSIDPIDVINEYGADAMRLSLISGIAPGVDFKFYEEKIVGQRNFINKVWNISRFILSNLDDDVIDSGISAADIKSLTLSYQDKWILSRLDNMIDLVTRDLDEYKFGSVSDHMVDFVWRDLADWYIEIVKSDLYGDDKDRKKVVQEVLLYILTCVLVVLHPFAPYVTEVLWGQIFSKEKDMLIVTKWVESGGFKDEELDSQFAQIKSVIVDSRVLLYDYGLENEKENKLLLKLNSEVDKNYLVGLCRKLVRNVTRVEIVSDFNDDVVVSSNAMADIGVEVLGEVREREEKKLTEEIDQLKKYTQNLDKKLANKGYMENAPEDVVQRDKDNLAEAEIKLEVYQTRLDNLKR